MAGNYVCIEDIQRLACVLYKAESACDAADAKVFIDKKLDVRDLVRSIPLPDVPNAVADSKNSAEELASCKIQRRAFRRERKHLSMIYQAIETSSLKAYDLSSKVQDALDASEAAFVLVPDVRDTHETTDAKQWARCIDEAIQQVSSTIESRWATLVRAIREIPMPSTHELKTLQNDAAMNEYNLYARCERTPAAHPSQIAAASKWASYHRICLLQTVDETVIRSQRDWIDVQLRRMLAHARGNHACKSMFFVP